MCCSILCNCLYASRSCLNRLLLPLLLIDLALTSYILSQLAVNSPFACCTDQGIEDCSYDDIGGANNIEVVWINEGGYCARKDQETLDCYTDITNCAAALNPSIDMADLCTESVLDNLAFENWSWLLAILIVKIVGLLFLIFYDITHTWCQNKDTAEEDAKDTAKCCSCRCDGECCKSLILFMLRIVFLIFGTATTFIAIWLLKWTDRVSYSSCSLVEDGLESDCNTIEDECSWEKVNYYNIVWQNIELSGPYWADLAANVLSGILWVVKLAVVWYYGRHLARV